jgi:hypothetical protein
LQQLTLDVSNELLQHHALAKGEEKQYRKFTTTGKPDSAS